MANPKSEALAFRIWAYASPLGWDCTVKDIAEELGEGWQRVMNICRHRGWLGRMRHESRGSIEFLTSDEGASWFKSRHHFPSYADALKYSEHLL